MNSPLWRVLRESRPAWPGLGLSVASGTGAALSGVGLMAASAWLIARAAQHPPILYLTVAIVAVRAFGVGRAVLRYGERLSGHDAALRGLAASRARAYERLERATPGGTGWLRTGDLVTRFVTDMDSSMDVLTRVATPLAVAVLAGAATVVFLFTLLPAAGLSLLVGLVLVGVAAPVIHSGLSRRADAASAPLRGELSAQVVELLHGATDLLAAGAADVRLAAVLDTDRRLRRASSRTAATVGVGAALTAAVAGACVLASLIFGAHAVRAASLDGVLLAVLVLTPMAAFELVAPVPAALATAGVARTALRRAHALMDAAPAVGEPQQARELPPAPYHLRLDAVSARWGEADAAAVTDLTIDLPPGARVALVGPTGSGKSTAAALAVRFLDPERGSVTLNGIDLRDLRPSDVRRVVGLVAEDAHIFHTTIEENLRLGRRDATAAELLDVLGRVHLLDWVLSLPEGLATRVGERGTAISGGQRRRLILARALLHDYPIIILDEPTEHLDEGLAEDLMADVLANLGGTSLLLITHRGHGLDAMDTVIDLAAVHG